MERYLVAALFLAACGDGGDGGGDDGDDGPPTIPYDTLAEYGLFTGDGSTQEPVAGVVPYEVLAPLYSDRTVKHRFVQLPPGGTIDYDNENLWTWPDGTILVKTFAFPVDARDPGLGEQLLETRLLIKEAQKGWTAHTYRWNAEQTEATRLVPGARVPVSWIDETGTTIELEYRIPNTNQCQACHGETTDLHPLGPRTRQLNGPGAGVDNQLDDWIARGMFSPATPPQATAGERPAITDYRDELEPTEARARAYLEANCAHCHREGAPAESSGLRLGLEEMDEVDLGVCRNPFSAGNTPPQYQYDVVPGHPELSLMIYRMESTDPEIKMPELPTVTSDAEGVAIVSAWIAAMPENLCE